MNTFLKLSNRECQVLSELLYYNDKLSSYSEDHKWKLVFEKDNRARIQKELGISVHQFNNILSSLRKRGIIVENTIKGNLVIYPDGGLDLNFKLLNAQPQEAYQEDIN